MGSFSIWHWLIVLLVVILIFGTKKLRNLGGDVGGAVKDFKNAMNEERAVPAGATTPAQTDESPAIAAKVVEAAPVTIPPETETIPAKKRAPAAKKTATKTTAAKSATAKSTSAESTVKKTSAAKPAAEKPKASTRKTTAAKPKTANKPTES